NPLSVVKERRQRIGVAWDDPRIKDWAGWSATEAPLPDDHVIVEWVTASDPKPLVVTDSYGAFQNGDQNDATMCRVFMHRCRRLADLGATVVVIHHDGKAESSRDYRGSSDFKAAVDLAFHVTNLGEGGLLGRLILRAWKTRIPCPPQ